MSRMLAFTLSMATLATGAMAADLPGRKTAPMPPLTSACTESAGIPTDAFGFTTGSDVADPGSLGASATYGGGYGTRVGRLDNHGLQLQLSYGLAPCLELGPYLLGGYTRASAAGVSADARSFGAGVEMKYKLLTRDRHGVGLTVVVDPSFTRNDPDGAPVFSAYNTGIRMFADAALVPGRLYGAINLSHDLSWTGPSPYLRSSTFTAAAALAWQVSDGLYLSGEVRHQRRHGELGFGKETGHATFAGPGIYWQATSALALSAAYNIQVAGKARGAPGNLDLTNFSQHLVKVKAAYGF